MPDGALSCPATLADRKGMTVPQPPGGVDGTARLLPDLATTSMVVCSYPVIDFGAAKPLSPPFVLARRVVSTADQRHRLVDRLTWAPRGGGPPGPCPAVAGNETAYLVGAVYDGAIVWVAATAGPSCSPATNGDFVARAGVGSDIEAIFTKRVPNPSAGAGAPCLPGPSGRLGDDRSLAPDGQPLVTVCRTGRDGQIPTALDADQSAQVVTALRSLPTRRTESSCSRAEGAQNGRQRDFSLVLRYPAGPAAMVNVAPGCRPELLSGGLEADDASAVVELVETWSKPLPYLDPNGSISSNGSGPSNGSWQGGATGTPGPRPGVASAGPAPLTGFYPAGPALGTPLPSAPASGVAPPGSNRTP